MAWPDLRTYLRSLEDNGDLLRISHPVDVHLEAGCIADKFVKRGGPAIIFDQPRLANGRICEFPLVMNLFGTRERVNKALGVEKPEEIGERMVALMKPDIGAVLKNPFSGIGLAKQGMSMAPKRIKKGACQAIRIENPDITKLPIPTTWWSVHDTPVSHHTKPENRTPQHGNVPLSGFRTNRSRLALASSQTWSRTRRSECEF